MSELRDILQTYVSNGSVPGAVGQLELGGPDSPALIQDFWRYAANA